jgi:hypothetical protein
MGNEQEPTGEERELLDLLSESALNDYPNPERIGCPGDSFLRQLANDRKSVPIRDARLDHVLHCSPCFREFTAFRAKRGHSSGRGRKEIVFALAAAAVLIVAVAIWIAYTHGNRNHLLETNSNSTPIVAQIDLQDRSIMRGAPTTPEAKQPLHLPRGQLRLTVLLPFGSDAGTYEVQILRDIQKPLLTAAGSAEIVDGVTKLSVDLNTSALRPGKYMLGVRRLPLDWTYNPITVE